MDLSAVGTNKLAVRGSALRPLKPHRETPAIWKKPDPDIEPVTILVTRPVEARNRGVGPVRQLGRAIDAYLQNMAAPGGRADGPPLIDTYA